MPQDPRDALEVLRCELSFLEQGGYRGQKNALTPVSYFQDSLSCINYGLPRRPNGCERCVFWDFVPEQFRGEDVPCHFIPLTAGGLTVESRQSEAELEENLKSWLRETIAKLEEQRAKTRS